MPIVPAYIVRPARPGIPMLIPDEARLFDVAANARAIGLRLVHNGERIYLTPQPLPGEFVIGAEPAAA